jgi:hypothetical protein
MDFDLPFMLWGAFFGVVGMAYFVYGKKQAAPIPMIVGGLLCFYPYFVSSLTAVIAIGVVLSAVPYVAKRLGY